MDIFKEFNNQIEQLTDLRVGDKVWSVSSFDGVYEVEVNSLGFSPQTNTLCVNGNTSTKYYRTKEEAENAYRQQEIKNLTYSISRTQERINDLKEEMEDYQKELRELIFSSNTD